MEANAFEGLRPVTKRFTGGELDRKTKRIVIPSAVKETAPPMDTAMIVPAPVGTAKKQFSLVPCAPALLAALPQGIVLSPGWLLIGRSPVVELAAYKALVLNLEGVSKLHAAVTEHKGKAFVSDFGSTNGTKILRDQKTIGVNEEPTQLLADDILWIGPVFFQIALS